MNPTDEGMSDDGVRYSLSDASGVLRFDSFAIEYLPDGHEAEQILREYLVGRPLAEVNPGHLRELMGGDAGDWRRAIIAIVEECQIMFNKKRVHKTNNRRWS